MREYDVFGVGSALVDFLVEIDDDEFLEFSLEKGNFHLVDEMRSKEILEKLKHKDIKIDAGGSAANTIAGVAFLGGKSVFYGNVGEDEQSLVFEQKNKEAGVRSVLGKSKGMTGYAITFITPDSQRTFATNLGASLALKEDDSVKDLIAKSRIVHLEGYQLEDENLRKVSLFAMKAAKENGCLVSIDLADPGLIERNLSDLRKIIKEFADIVFVNEEEAKAFTGREEKEALEELSKFCDYAVVKLGEKGSLIKHDGKVYRVGAIRTDAVDTTGAGDMYAAGILYGIARGLSLDEAGKIASENSAKVVSQIGARLK
ncbi:adenosine kinase [Candidatus Woesearchaeota archaeon]|nr:adenosine kinase [Candidatus Woesearchaeota archaeon]